MYNSVVQGGSPFWKYSHGTIYTYLAKLLYATKTEQRHISRAKQKGKKKKGVFF